QGSPWSFIRTMAQPNEAVPKSSANLYFIFCIAALNHDVFEFYCAIFWVYYQRLGYALWTLTSRKMHQMERPLYAAFHFLGFANCIKSSDARQMLFRQRDIPIQASGVGHGIAVQYFFYRLAQHQFFDRQLLFFA
ncbi:MAG: hypothetical protein RL631_1517, partial [Pseudomonadota bacterium]